MKLNLKTGFTRLLAVVLAAALAPVVAATPGGAAKFVATLQVRDLSGAQSTLAERAPVGGPWVMAVVDIQVAQSQALLEALQEAGRDGAGLVVVVCGPQAGTEAFIRRQLPRLPAATWLAVEPREIRQVLGLPGTPALVGVEAGGGIGWTFVGVPSRKGQAEAMVKDWRARASDPVMTK